MQLQVPGTSCLPSDSGTPRCGQRSRNARTCPSLSRSSMTRSPSRVSASGLAPRERSPDQATGIPVVAEPEHRGVVRRPGSPIARGRARPPRAATAQRCSCQSNFGSLARARVDDRIDQALRQALHGGWTRGAHGEARILRRRRGARQPKSRGGDAAPAQNRRVGGAAGAANGLVRLTFAVLPGAHERLDDPVVGFGARARDGQDHVEVHVQSRHGAPGCRPARRQILASPASGRCAG